MPDIFDDIIAERQPRGGDIFDQIVSERKPSLLQQAGEFAKGYYDYLHTPTEPPTSIRDFTGRVIPESVAKTTVGVLEAPYNLIRNVTDPLLEGDIAGAGRGAMQDIQGVSQFVGRPLGIYGAQAAKEAWITDPAGSILAVAPLVKGVAGMVGEAVPKYQPKQGFTTRTNNLGQEFEVPIELAKAIDEGRASIEAPIELPRYQPSPLERPSETPDFLKTREEIAYEARVAAENRATAERARAELEAGMVKPDIFDQIVSERAQKTAESIGPQIEMGGMTPVEQGNLPRTAQTFAEKAEVPRAATQLGETILRQNIDLYNNRTPKTFEQMRQEGLTGGPTLEQLKKDVKKSGVIYNDYQTRAVGEMATGLLDDLSKNWGEYDATTRNVKLDNAINAYFAYLKVGTEQGRALAARKAKLNPNGALEAEAMRKFLKDARKAGLTKEMIKEQLEGVDITKPNEIYRKIAELNEPTVADKIYEWWANIHLLANPTTHAANITGNLANISLKPPARAFAGAIDKLTSKPGERVVYTGEALAQLKGVGKGLKEGLDRAKFSWENEGQTLSGSKIDIGSRAAIKGEFGKAVRAPGYRALTFMDEWAKGVIASMERSALAYRMARQEKLSGAQLDQRVEELIQFPTREMLEAMRKEEVHIAMQDPLGPVTSAFNKLRNSVPLNFGRVIVPFMQFAVNLAKRAFVELSPLGYGRAALKVAKGSRPNLLRRSGLKPYESKAQMLEDLGSASVGTALYSTFAALWANGLITGNGPDDPNQRRLLMEGGWKPQSLKVPESVARQLGMDGDTYVSYSRIEPFASMLGLSIDLMDAAKEAGKDVVNWEDVGGRLAMAWSRNIYNKSFMQGLSRFTDAMSEPQRYGKDFIRGLATSAIPAGVASLARSTDPYLRDIADITDAMRNRIPGEKANLEFRYNVFGEPQKIMEGPWYYNMLVPFQWRTSKKDVLIDELVKYDVYPGRLGRRVGNQPLSSKQYAKYARLAGQLSRGNVRDLYSSPGYSSLTDDQKHDALRSAIQNGRAEARERLRGGR